jgi:hypothetical protein
MIIVIAFIIVVLVTACGDLPLDQSPIWSKANRYAQEQVINCNRESHSIGLSGCAFLGNPDPNATLTIPDMWNSRLTFTSSNCDNKEYLSQGNPLIIKLSDLYTNKDGKSCSFTIIHEVENFKGKLLDAQALGRFFIKIVPPNRYHSLLDFSLPPTSFHGAGYYQRRYGKNPPELEIRPKSSTGTFLMKCGTTTLVNQLYTSTPFKVTIPQGVSCDFELSAINDNIPSIEFGTLVYEEQQNTEDISIPKAYIKKANQCFSFENDVNSKNDNVVIGVAVNGTPCPKYYCCVPKNQAVFEVKAITSTLRFFYGTYNSATGIWSTK